MSSRPSSSTMAQHSLAKGRSRGDRSGPSPTRNPKEDPTARDVRLFAEKAPPPKISESKAGTVATGDQATRASLPGEAAVGPRQPAGPQTRRWLLRMSTRVPSAPEASDDSGLRKVAARRRARAADAFRAKESVGDPGTGASLSRFDSTAARLRRLPEEPSAPRSPPTSATERAEAERRARPVQEIPRSFADSEPL